MARAACETRSDTIDSAVTGHEALIDVGGVEVSVVIVSDWVDPEHYDWRHEREIVKAVSGQDFSRPMEVFLVEDSRCRDLMPVYELREQLPALRVEFADLRRSSELKDWGVGLASGRYVAVFEADCMPRTDWLSRAYSTLRENPAFKAVSGKTTYGDRSALLRVLTLLDRGFNDPGSVSETPHLSNNAALCERSFLLEYPYPHHSSPFVSSRERISLMQRDGHRFLANPDAVVMHAMEGWGFVRDLRRSVGFGDMVWADDRRWTAIPRLLWTRMRAEFGDCLRLHRRYIRWYDWPLLAFLLIFLRFLEVPGMLDALAGKAVPERTGYR